MARPSSLPLLLAIPIAAALLASAGCDDRFRSADRSPPRVVRIILADPEGAAPAREVLPDGADVLVTDVPLQLSAIHVRFSKPVDGATIQKSSNPVLTGAEPGGNLLPLGCEPAPNVVVTQVGGAGASTFTASVCYDPSGPDMIVEPAVATCAGPVPSGAFRASASSSAAGLPALERGATYVIQATDLKDQQGNAISFRLSVVTSATLALASDPSDASVEPVMVSTQYAADGTVAGYAALDPASALTGVPPGPPAAATGAPNAARVNEKTTFTAFGPDILMRLDAPLCAPRGDAADLPQLPGYCAPMGVDTGNVPGVSLAVGGTSLDTIAGAPAASLHFPFRGGYETISDRYVGGDASALHLVPWLPLEDGQTYTLTLDGGLTDVTGAAFGTTRTFAFQAAAGEFRVQLVQPPDGATGVPPSTDLLHHANASTGHGIEFVVSRPLALDGAGHLPVGAVELHEGGADGPLATVGGVPLGGDVAALDTRGRWFAIGATVGQGDLALKAGQRYTVVLRGLASAADPGVTIPSFQWTFTTATFSRDAVRSTPVVASAVGAVDPVPTAGGAVNGAFLVQYVSGRVKHDSTATALVAPQVGGEQFFPLLGAPGKTASVSLLKLRDGSGQACATGCEVAGIAGLVKTTTGLDLFANGAADDPNPNLRNADLGAAKPRAGLPRSAVGFLPDQPLEPGAGYQLTLSNVVDANDVPLADLDENGQFALSFTTRPFGVLRVLSRAAVDAGERGDALQSGARFVSVDGSRPLAIELSASPDVPAGGLTTAGDLANDPVALVDSRTGKGEPLAIAPDTTSTVRLLVRPVSTLAPGVAYLVLVTSKLKAKGSGASAEPFSLALTTPDARDGSGDLVCQ